MKIGFKHNTKEWDDYMTKVRAKFPDELKTIVSSTTKKISQGAKSAVITKHKGIKSSIRAHIKGYSGDVSVNAHYAPYIEFGTGRLVEVHPELVKVAREFKGKGIREVNRPALPFLFPHFFLQRDKFYKAIENLLKRI